MSVKKEARTIWDIPLTCLYPLVIEFYRKEKDSIVLDYEQRVRLLAFFKQENVGPYTADKDSDTGYFDVVGSHRRKAWIALGSMPKDEARQGLIKLLDAATPRLKDTILQQWREKKRQEEKESESAEEDKIKQRDTNATKDPSHTSTQGTPSHPTPPSQDTPSQPTPPAQKSEPVRSILAPAALWCSPKAARHFINQVKSNSSSVSSTLPDNKLLVHPGESVTVQVPTSTLASAIFWEFVTENEDIGFGLRYQRSPDGTSPEYPMDQLLPVTRRDCSEDLVLGSHQYMTQGTYYLQFDNSHSKTGTKVVYYKVFYQTIQPNQ